jgi:hypothetical protein
MGKYMINFINDHSWNKIEELLNKINIGNVEVNINCDYAVKKLKEIDIEISENSTDLNKKLLKGEVFKVDLIKDIAAFYYLKWYETNDNSYLLNAKRFQSIFNTLVNSLDKSYFNIDRINQFFNIILRVKYKSEIEFIPDQIIVHKTILIDLLKHYNYEYSVKKNTVEIDKIIINDISQKILNIVSRIGGYNLYKYLMNNYYYSEYNNVLDLYLLQCNQKKILINKKFINIDIPLNFLVYIAIKSFNIYITNELYIIEEDINDLIRLSNILVNLNIDFIDCFTLIKPHIAFIPHIIKNELVKNKFLVFRQNSLEFLEVLIKYFFLPNWKTMDLNFTFNDLIKFLRYVGKKKISFITSVVIKEIHYYTKISNKSLIRILDFFSIDIKILDKNNISFDINDDFNYIDYPIFKMDKEKYIMLDVYMVALGFFYKLENHLKLNFNNLERETGKILENLINDYLVKNNICCYSGEYENILKSGYRECDFFIPGKRIILIEAKRKTAIEEFNTLRDVDLWGNIGMGMLKAQCQAFYHEAVLYRSNKIIFRNMNHEINVKLEQLPALKISVCLGEYDFITSKIFTKLLLKTIYCCSIKSVDAEYDGRLKSIAKCKMNLNDAITLSERKVSNLDNLFSHSMFLSIQQLFLIIKISKNNEEFIDNLIRINAIDTKDYNKYSCIPYLK